MEGLIRFAVMGSVDDGKSTLIGRLLYETDALPKDVLASVHDRGAIDFSWITDGLSSEREQGITIDVAYKHFATPTRAYLIADTPGHVQYTANMASGVSVSHFATLLVDVSRGPTEQTLRHARIAKFAGVHSLLVAINKMDAVDYRAADFMNCVESLASQLRAVGFEDVRFIPVSALRGDNLVAKSKSMPWYEGRTLLEELEALEEGRRLGAAPFRMQVQRVLLGEGKRFYAGRITAGRIECESEVVLLPSRVATKVRKIFVGAVEKPSAETGDSIAIELSGDFDLGRGGWIAAPDAAFESSDAFDASIIWFGTAALDLRSRPDFILKQGAFETRVRLESVAATEIPRNEAGEARLRFSRAISLPLGAPFILIDPVGATTVAAGISRKASAAAISANDDAVTVWLTGLPSAGKSTISNALKNRLDVEGRRAVILDGDVVRKGLSADLGFTAEDRAENVRRVAEVAKMLNEAGAVAIVALISPSEEERRRARDLIGSSRFLEVFVDAPLAVCEARDVKGNYRKARAGAIPNFTGVSAPYEIPAKADLHLKTAESTVDDCVTEILRAIERLSR